MSEPDVEFMGAEMNDSKPSSEPFSAGNLIALGGITTFPFLLANLFVARRVQDRHTLAVGSAIGLAGLLLMIALLKRNNVQIGTLPGEWNSRISLAIQYSNYTGRVTEAVWGGAGVKIAVVGIGGVMFRTLWRDLKAKMG
ncbi:hypothetical protein GLOTRDRAFT_132580 [Gloeophyllum trabeum ATCC 11539]|uniref:Uncharacterized protein n=1 Tax=Gloeophyllum trabeum (strain ATCC 11539 / FP-39264 / Madison 617) TaxID=670483 RepID=S7PWK5_GLOTA|nr:uncharacterized protein GLOTRDRAFT_132580 [Gloeophyllum trabeum ATCC 11539]EPQ51762.1 hypothetical protein GLOTRDRAFT_132580 [Gloeophyllum trabeum ATCC 11539]